MQQRMHLMNTLVNTRLYDGASKKHITDVTPIFIKSCVNIMQSIELVDVSTQIVKSMCESFEVPYSETVFDRYRLSTISYLPYKELHLLVKRTDWCIYIDKLWVKNKGNGAGTKYFGEFLEQSTMPLLWRTRTERKRNWYMRFKGVRSIAEHQGYYFLTYDAGKRHNWTFEDLYLFNEPSLR